MRIMEMEPTNKVIDNVKQVDDSPFKVVTPNIKHEVE